MSAAREAYYQLQLSEIVDRVLDRNETEADLRNRQMMFMNILVLLAMVIIITGHVILMYHIIQRQLF